MIFMQDIWEKIAPYFLKKEAWGDPDKMSGLILMLLYEIRFQSGWPTIIHCGTQGTHCTNSQHYKGNAVDFHFEPPGDSIDFRGQATFLMKYLAKLQVDNFCGVGIYPEWIHPGFHLDVRGEKARWLKRGGEYIGVNRF